MLIKGNAIRAGTARGSLLVRVVRQRGAQARCVFGQLPMLRL
jgi:hypothetical protein